MQNRAGHGKLINLIVISDSTFSPCYVPLYGFFRNLFGMFQNALGKSALFECFNPVFVKKYIYSELEDD